MNRVSAAKVYTHHPALPPSRSDHSTICILCSHNCGIKVSVANNEIVEVRGDETSPTTHGYVCNKAFALNHYVHHDNRVKRPLKKQADGSFAEISWDQAIEEIAGKLNHIRKTYSPKAIGIAGLGGQGGHVNGLGALPLLYGIGVETVYTALGQEKTQHAMIERRLIRGTHDIYLTPDKHHADYVLIFGHNPLISNQGYNTKDHITEIIRNPERRLVVVDPRITETTRKAHRHLRVKPGKDVYLMMAIAAVIIQENRVDAEFVRDKLYEYHKLESVFRRIDIAEMARRCQIDEDDIRATAREFAEARRATILLDLGLEHSAFNTLTSYLNRVIALITGNYGRVGGNLLVQMYGPKFPVIPNSTKALESGIEGILFVLPLPTLPPAILPEEIESSHPHRLRALICDGANPLASYPDTQAFERAFDKLDLLVVIDPVMSETARKADYILPPPVSYEKWDWSIFPKNIIAPQIRPPIINSEFATLPEPEIYFRLAHAMGIVEPAPRILHRLARSATNPGGLGAAAYLGALNTLAAARGGGMRGIIARSTFWLYETLGAVLPNPMLAYMWLLTVGYASTRRSQVLKALPELKSIRNPFKLANLLFAKMLANPQGVKLGEYENEHNFEYFCRYKDGRARIYQADFIRDLEQMMVADPEPDDPEYPFILNGGLRTGFTANTIMQNPAWRKGKGSSHAALYISPEDAARLAIADGDSVRISTRRGSVVAPAKLDSNTMSGHLSLPNMLNQRYPDPVTGELKQIGVRINDLVDARDRDPYTGCPHTKRLRCKLEKVAVEAVV